MSEQHEARPDRRMIRVAVAQTVQRDDPSDVTRIRASGDEVRQLMCTAAAAGARLVHFPEGAICSPGKWRMSSDPDRVAAADWSRAEWPALQDEVAQVAALAAELGVWVVLGAQHRLSAPNRPHNSLYVISDAGQIVTRYDERMLSATKVTFMYAPGAEPVTFEVDGFRFGCALGMEVHFAEIFAAYEQLDVDAVLFSTAGPGTGSAASWLIEAMGHAVANAFWVSFAGPSEHGADAPAGVAAPDGGWVARCAAGAAPGIAVAELVESGTNPARPWRRTARSGIYAEHLVTDDPRSRDRAAL